MSSGTRMSEEEWKKVVEKFETMREDQDKKIKTAQDQQKQIDFDLNIDMSEIEEFVKQERTKPQDEPQGKSKGKSKGKGKQKQKQVHQDPMEQLEKLNKTQLKEFDKNHDTNLRKCALLLDAKYVKRDAEN